MNCSFIPSNLTSVLITIFHSLIAHCLIYPSAAMNLDMKLAQRHVLHLSSDQTINAQISQRPPHNPTSESHITRSRFQELLARRNLGQHPEAVVLQHIRSLVVCAQVVYLLLVQGSPEICANELHCIQLVFVPSDLFCQSTRKLIISGSLSL